MFNFFSTFFQLSYDIWYTDYNTDNWEPGFITIVVTWQLIVTLDSIRNSCDVFWYTIVYIISICCPLNILSIVARKTNNCVKRKSSLLTCPKDLWLSLLQRKKSALICKRKVGMASKGGSNPTGDFHQNWVFKILCVIFMNDWSGLK